MSYLKQYEPNKKRIAALNFDNPNPHNREVAAVSSSPCALHLPTLAHEVSQCYILKKFVYLHFECKMYG